MEANLALSETKLAARQNQLSVEHLKKQLERSDCELQRLKLRYENRPSSYFVIMKEHFGIEKLSKLVDPAHKCECN